ncbi:fungal-specific transcription factor domain-containing protein, partial [Vararia minispora EC-137]
MSSLSDSDEGAVAKPRRYAKRNRISLACDRCRRRKSDGKQTSGKCTNCGSNGWDCSFMDATKVRSEHMSDTVVRYVEALEAHITKYEKLVKRLHPDRDFSSDTGPRPTRDNWRQSDALEDQEPEQLVLEPSAGPSVPSIAPDPTLVAGPSTLPPIANVEPSEPSTHLDDNDIDSSLENLSKDFEQHVRLGGFYGRSSGDTLIGTLLRIRAEAKGLPISPATMSCERRPVYWALLPWENEMCDPRRRAYAYTFPEPDLMNDLINIYFDHSNVVLPILHRPTFEQSFREGKHTIDGGFGGVVLMVCAIASRFSSDPRVILPGSDSRLSSGWAWFNQVHLTSNLIFSGAPLHDLQIACLCATYLLSGSAFHASWITVGLGIRLAQDFGAHRKTSYGSKPTVEDELYKRSFWVLVCMDRWISMSTGRPCAVQEEDFDLEMPIDCDDEYWTHPDPSQAFKQPPGKPSLVSNFISNLKLVKILGFALRTIYASGKAKSHHKFAGEEWESRSVADFDRVLNEWVDSVPYHLRWDPAREDDAFFFQSAHLYTQFYDLQIAIHRRFISPQKETPHSFSSLAICITAARSCCHIVDRVQRRWPARPAPYLQRPFFNSAIILLLEMWNARKSDMSVNLDTEAADLSSCMSYMQTMEDTWYAVGRVTDVLNVLSVIADLPMPSTLPLKGRKRSRRRSHDHSSPS